jgi:hypothetical protein
MGAKAEERARKRLRGQAMPASGALPGAKGDYNLPEFKVDVKATQKATRSISMIELQKITHEAANEGRTPALQIVFAEGNGQPRPNGSWMVIPEWAFKELTEDE